MGSTATVTHSAADNVNFTFACDPGRQWSPAPAYLEGFPCLESFQRALLCRGNFFISKSWKGSSRHLKPFWARISVCSAEPACRRFSVGVGGGPASVNKVLCGTPLPDRRSGLILGDFHIGERTFQRALLGGRGTQGEIVCGHREAPAVSRPCR